MKSSLSLLLCVLLQVLTGIPAFAQQKKPEPDPAAAWQDPGRMQRIRALFPVIQRLYEEHAKANHIPGLAFGLVVDGQLVLTGGYGYADIDKKIPAQSSTVFRIASMSKSLTAMAILQLRDAGRLSLEEPASKYIPQLAGLKYPTTDAAPITVRHLLTHGAGFPEDNPWGDRQLADTDKELMDLIARQFSFSNPPGTAYEYSNLGFALLGKIVTVVSGQPYQQYIRDHIFLPLGMRHSTYEYSEVPGPALAHGYRWIYGNWREEELLHDTPDGSWGAMGAMLSSVDDFAAYMAVHLNAWPPSDAADKGPLKRSSVREMHHPWRFSFFQSGFQYPSGRPCGLIGAYGYGLRWSRDCEGRNYIEHSGGLPGFGSMWRIMPDYGIGVIALGNRTYSPMGGINFQVLDTLVRGASLKPRPVTVSAILAQRQQELVRYLPDWKGAEASGIFAENFFPDNPIDLLQKQCREVFAKAGKIRNILPIVAENQLRGTFRMEGEEGNVEVYFTLSPENPPLIQEFRIRAVK